MRRCVHKPYNKLKGALRERGLTYADVAVILNISETAVSFKINGLSDFYIGEVNKLETKCGIGTEVYKPDSCECNDSKI